MTAVFARFAMVLSALAVALVLTSWLWPPLKWVAWIGAVYVAVQALRHRGPLIGLARIKMREWGTDLRQLFLWARLAFKRRRDDQDVAAMAHQARFLDGRMISPVNIFTYLPLILGIVGLVTIGVDQWRIDRIKRERDAPCSERELSQTDGGRFRTSRAACAQLGATNEVAQLWQRRASQVEQEWARDLASIREETAAEIARQQADAQRRQAALARQRRRDNESITTALGGGPPDLERSLCELAGLADCAPASGDGAGAGAPPASVVPGDAGSAGAAAASSAP